MFIVDILAAATQAAPQNKFGFAEALEQGGFIAYATVVIIANKSIPPFSGVLRTPTALTEVLWSGVILRRGPYFLPMA